MVEPSLEPTLVIWRLRDPWRDLTSELGTASEPVTVVSINGTARIMAEGWQVRVPLEGGHVMARDLVRHPLARIITATPCGVCTTDGRGGWHATTPLILVLAGEHPRWLRTPAGQEALTSVRARGWQVDGHPDEPCGAAYCPRRG